MANICDLNNQKPNINYPTFWEYKVIFQTDIDANSVAKEIIKDREFKLSFSKNSKDNKYKSYSISVLVFNDFERLQIFNAFKKVAKYVL